MQRTQRIRYKDLQRLKPGSKPLPDPEVRGLRWLAQPQGVYAQFRYKDPATGKWRSKGLGLGRVPTTEAERKDFIADWSQEIYETTGENPVTMWADLDDTLDRYRERAQALKAKVRARLDPRSEVGPEGLTLRQARELHLRAPGLSARTIEDVRYFTDRFLSDWLDVPLRQLTRPMVRERHEAIANRAYRPKKKDAARGGPVAANKVMRYLRALWNTGRREDPELPEAPTAVLRKRWQPEKREGKPIPLAELPRWFAEVEALRARGGGAAQRADWYLLAVLTGLRRTSLSTIWREHVDLKAGTLHIPLPKGGAARAFTLPLSDAALALIDRVLRSHNSEWLWPSDSKSGHLEEPKALASDGFTVRYGPHRLRHTFNSVATAAGVSPYHTKLLMNHKLPKSDITGAYVGADPDALRPSTQIVTDFLRRHGLPL